MSILVAIVASFGLPQARQDSILAACRKTARKLRVTADELSGGVWERMAEGCVDPQKIAYAGCRGQLDETTADRRRGLTQMSVVAAGTRDGIAGLAVSRESDPSELAAVRETAAAVVEEQMAGIRRVGESVQQRAAAIERQLLSYGLPKLPHKHRPLWPGFTPGQTSDGRVFNENVLRLAAEEGVDPAVIRRKLWNLAADRQALLGDAWRAAEARKKADLYLTAQK
jgi:hypothetical protein